MAKKAGFETVWLSNQMRYGKFDSLEEIKERINSITAEQLLRVANEIFNVEKLHILKYI